MNSRSYSLRQNQWSESLGSLSMVPISHWTLQVPWAEAETFIEPNSGPRVEWQNKTKTRADALGLWQLYLHWFDHLFQRADGPAHWAKAKLVRYADDFVVLARYISPRLRDWIEGKLEGWLGLQLNREKTRVLDLCGSGQSLDFLGYTFRYHRDRFGRTGRRYLHLQPSRKAMAREREALRALINPHHSHTPLPELIGSVNRQMRGWSNYFKLGQPRQAFRHLNHFVRHRVGKHLRRRSQRGWRARQGISLHTHLQHLGLVAL